MANPLPRLALLAAAGLAAVALAACGGGGKSTAGAAPNQPPVGPPPLRFELFGRAFAMIFESSPNSEPTEPSPSDVPAVSLPTEPAEVA